MQGKALVVNPAVIQPSAPPTIVVGRVRGEMARFPRVWTCDPTWRNTGKKTPEEPGRTRDRHTRDTRDTRAHGSHSRTSQPSKPNDGRHTRTGPHDQTRRQIQVGCGKRAAGVHGQSVRQVTRYGPTTRVHGVAHLSRRPPLPIFHRNAIMLEAWP